MRFAHFTFLYSTAHALYLGKWVQSFFSRDTGGFFRQVCVSRISRRRGGSPRGATRLDSLGETDGSDGYSLVRSLGGPRNVCFVGFSKRRYLHYLPSWPVPNSAPTRSHHNYSPTLRVENAIEGSRYPGSPKYNRGISVNPSQIPWEFAPISRLHPYWRK